jgi:GT2 family glycosyltransferase
MSLPLVSLISINYNQAQVTCDMVASLRRVTYPHLEIIVVDNASPSDNPDIIKERFPEVKLIKSDQNLGFAGGNNLGIAQAKGEYLLFLNNDTEVEPDFLEPLVRQPQSRYRLAQNQVLLWRAPHSVCRLARHQPLDRP